MQKNTRNVLSTIGAIAGYFAFICFAPLGQAGVLGAILKPLLPGMIGNFIAIFLILPPWLIVFLLTFYKQPIVTPRACRQCLTLAMCWFAVVATTGEVLCQLGYTSPDSQQEAEWLSRGLMHTGWLVFIPLIQLCLIARRYERLWERRARRDVKPAATTPDATSESN